jgi:hypothetical protein
MTTWKRSLMVVSFSLALIAWGALFPTLTIGSDVQVGTADFGEVVVGSTSTIPLQITNTGSMSVILYLWFDNYSCSFFLDRQSDILLNPGGSITVNMSWTPPEGSEGTTCSDTLNVFYGETETVLVTGTAVDASALPRDLTPNMISIGECDTEVTDFLYEKKGISVSEWITQCEAEAKNHGQFVSCVTHLTNELKEAGLISGREKGAIQSCADKAKFAHSLSSRRP